MKQKARPAERLDKEIQEKLPQGLAAAVARAQTDSEGLLSDVLCLTVRRLLQRALAAAAQQQAADPAAVKCLWDDPDAGLTLVELPESQRRFIPTTNLLECACVAPRRRTKIIPGFCPEPRGLKLGFGTLIRVRAYWRRVKMTILELDLRRQIRQSRGGAENRQFRSLDSCTKAAGHEPDPILLPPASYDSTRSCSSRFPRRQGDNGSDAEPADSLDCARRCRPGLAEK